MHGGPTGEMTYSIAFVEDAPYDLVVRTAGVASLQGLAGFTRAALADDRSRPGMRVLVDHSALDWSGITRTDLMQRVDEVARTVPAAQLGGVAVVVGADLAAGLQRMIQAYLDDRAGRAGIRLRVFYSVAEAEEWLGAAVGS